MIDIKKDRKHKIFGETSELRSWKDFLTVDIGKKCDIHRCIMEKCLTLYKKGDYDMEEKNMYKEILESLYEGIYFINKDRRINFWNKAAEKITGFSSEEVKGKFCCDNILNHTNYEGIELCKNGCPLHASLQDGLIRENIVYIQHKKGKKIAVAIKTIPVFENGKFVGAIEVFTDDREKTKMLYKMDQLKELALYDQLTKLPNRVYIENYLSARVDDYNQYQIKIGVIFMDVDYFKNVNDTYGHDIGDDVLKMVSKIIKSSIRKNDMVGRWGGEEFIGIFTEINKEELINISEKIRILVENSKINSGMNEISVTVSIGAIIFRGDETIDQIIKRADNNMYAAKDTGRNRVVFK